MTPMPQPARWWIVGASEGLGRALARALDAQGAALVLSARSADRLADLAAGLRDAQPVPMDVTDPASVAAAARAAGRIDGLIYCAGAYRPMSATGMDPGAAATIADTNFTGALRVVGAALPDLLARRAGRLVLVGSLSGFRGLPGAIGYGASKAAVMHLAENLRADLRDTGVTVQVVNPGFIDTRLTRQNDFRMPMIMSPEDAAARVLRAIRRGRFSTSFPAPFSWLFRLGACLPLSLFQALFR